MSTPSAGDHGRGAPIAVLARLGGDRRTLSELRDELFLSIGDVAGKQSRFWILLLLSAVIATGGVLVDSTATVIGAMIVAPLGTPIMGIGLGLVVGDPKRIGASFAVVTGGVVLVIVVAAVLSWILPQVTPLASNGQVTGRTSPGVIDLAAAIATGFAGAYGLARKDVSDVMPGVAIAISLVPPLAVVGITAQGGDWGSAWGAFVLFASNVVAMILAATFLFTLYGYHGEAVETPGFRRRRAYIAISVSLVVILVPLVITTARTVLVQAWKGRTAEVARAWVAPTDYHVIGVEIRGSDLVVVIEGSGAQPPVADLLVRLSGEVPSGMRVLVNRVSGSVIDAGQVPG